MEKQELFWNEVNARQRSLRLITHFIYFFSGPLRSFHPLIEGLSALHQSIGFHSLSYRGAAAPWGAIPFDCSIAQQKFIPSINWFHCLLCFHSTIFTSFSLGCWACCGLSSLFAEHWRVAPPITHKEKSSPSSPGSLTQLIHKSNSIFSS